MSLEIQRSELHGSYTKDQIEKRIWEQADRLSKIREELGAYQARLYDEVDELRKRSKSLSPREQADLGRKDNEYYRIADKLLAVRDEEDALAEILSEVENDTADLNQLGQLFIEDEEEGKGPEKKLSKREKRREEERERLRKLGYSEFEIAWDLRYAMHGEFGANPTKLTTGRNRSRVTGNFTA